MTASAAVEFTTTMVRRRSGGDASTTPRPAETCLSWELQLTNAVSERRPSLSR